MYKNLLFLSILALFTACRLGASLLKSAENDPTIPVTLTELRHTTQNDQVFTVSGFVPFPHMDISGSGATSYGYGGDIRWRSLRLGEAQLTLNNRALMDLGTIGYNPSDGTKNIFQFNASYRFPLVSSQKEKLTKAWTTLHGYERGYNTSYYMLHQSPVFRAWNVRGGLQNDLAGCKTDAYTLELRERYDTITFKSSGSGNARIQQVNTLARVGVSLTSSQYLTFKGNHTSMGDFKGSRFRHWELYADVSALLHSNLSDVRYRYALAYNNAFENVVIENVNMEPFLKKHVLGLSVGYYVESYPSPDIRFLMLTFRSEIGVRPGYFTQFSDAIFVRLAFGIGFNLCAKGR